MATFTRTVSTHSRLYCTSFPFQNDNEKEQNLHSPSDQDAGINNTNWGCGAKSLSFKGDILELCFSPKCIPIFYPFASEGKKNIPIHL